MNHVSASPGRNSSPSYRASILVVEDEFLVRMVLSDKLREAEYYVVEAASADEAVAILKSGAQFDLIVSDVRMPGALDGLGLLAWARETHPTIPVVITSSHLQGDRATADGAIKFLAKPYSLEQALAIVEVELEKCR